MVSYGAGTQWKSVFLSTHHPSVPHGGLVACWFQKLWPLSLQPAFIFLGKFFLHCSDQKKLEIIFLSVKFRKKIPKFWGIIHQNLETTQIFFNYIYIYIYIYNFLIFNFKKNP
jgi:hypothetical protein